MNSHKKRSVRRGKACTYPWAQSSPDTRESPDDPNERRLLVVLKAHNKNVRIARAQFLRALIPFECHRGITAHALQLSL